ncbi:hypothetical protein BVY03_02190 [bacterium K02(2017)]|nr:hypothetical protein BVY03_02190 [bacterium K02(2017)]
MKPLFNKICTVGVILAFIVVVLGAYVRLSHAGLSCPDWPSCYGTMLVTESAPAINQYPDRPMETHKAWKEMIHRYLAGGLGILILSMALLSLRKELKQIRLVSFFLLVLVIGQALLGMWTVTLKLHPIIVMAHLLGGLSTLSLLWYLRLRSKKLISKSVNQLPVASRFQKFALIGMTVLVLQIALGGWTSANYAALSCPDFPTCMGTWLPEMNFSEGFDFTRKIGLNYEFGLLEHEARVAIHYTHRVGAIVTAFVLLLLGIFGLQGRYGNKAKKIGGLLICLLVVQILFGISNVVFTLPVAVGAAHNAVAALLLLVMVSLNVASGRTEQEAA